MNPAFIKKPVILSLLVAVGLLAGCDPLSLAVKKPEFAVLDVFETGPSVYVRSLAVEEETNSLWVGTSIGVNEIDLGTFEPKNFFNRDSGLANEYVFGIGIDPDGYKWFGTNAGGMSRYKADAEQPWRTFFPMHGLADYWIYSFANHPDGSLWVGTWAGATRVDRDTLEMTTYVKELVNEWVYGLDVDRDGRVWFGTEGGVSMFDGEHWVDWNHDDGLGADNANALPFSVNTGLGTRSRHDLGILNAGQETYNPNYVFSLVVAEDDTIWTGTWGGGASQLIGDTWHNYTTDDGLSGNLVYVVIQADDGAMWFGTNHGISRFDGDKWQNFRANTDKTGSDVYTLVQAPNGDIWAGVRGAVIRIGQKSSDTAGRQ